MKKKVGPAFISIGILFLVIGFVQQGLKVSFISGMFNLGIIFFLSGLVATVIEKRNSKENKS